eukprot:6465315-Amphidinium_carterae.2
MSRKRRRPGSGSEDGATTNQTVLIYAAKEAEKHESDRDSEQAYLGPLHAHTALSRGCATPQVPHTQGRACSAHHCSATCGKNTVVLLWSRIALSRSDTPPNL